MANVVQVQVTGPDGSETVDVDIDYGSFTMREALALEEALGGETFDLLAAGKLGSARPSVVQAILFAKLRTVYPDATLDGFDFDLSALAGDDDPKGSAGV